MASNFYDSDVAVRRCGRMWRKLAGLFEAHANEMAKCGFQDQALKSARMAEVCFWQATGEMDCVNMRDVIPSGAPQ